jgi:hypothetical protein
LFTIAGEIESVAYNERIDRAGINQAVKSTAAAPLGRPAASSAIT